MNEQDNVWASLLQRVIKCIARQLNWTIKDLIDNFFDDETFYLRVYLCIHINAETNDSFFIEPR